MSIAQVKKQFEALESYLSKDKIGLDMLRKLKESYLDLRSAKRLAEERSVESTAARDACIASERRCQSELSAAKQELESAKSKIANLKRELASVISREGSDDHEDKEPLPSCVKTTIKKLIKRNGECPHLEWARASIAKMEYIEADRNCLSQGWSSDAIWALGASVAILAAFNGKVIVKTEETFANMWPGEDNNEATKLAAVKWMRRLWHKPGESNELDLMPVFINDYGKPITLREGLATNWKDVSLER